MSKEITFEELDHLIDSQEDKGLKKAMLIVKSAVRPWKENHDAVSQELFVKVVSARQTAEELVAEDFEEDYPSIHADHLNTAENLGKVILLSFPEDEE